MTVFMLPLCMMMQVVVQTTSIAGIGRHKKQRVIALSVQLDKQHKSIALRIPFFSSFFRLLLREQNTIWADHGY
jgi:hypothetical protein